MHFLLDNPSNDTAILIIPSESGKTPISAYFWVETYSGGRLIREGAIRGFMVLQGGKQKLQAYQKLRKRTIVLRAKSHRGREYFIIQHSVISLQISKEWFTKISNTFLGQPSLSSHKEKKT